MPKASEAKAGETKTAKVYNPWKDMITIKIPKSKTDKEDVPVSINERSFIIKRGVEVAVPRPVYEVLRDKEEAEAQRMAYIEANAN